MMKRKARRWSGCRNGEVPGTFLGDSQITLLFRRAISSYQNGWTDCDKVSQRLESTWFRPNNNEPKSPEEQQFCEVEKHVKVTTGKEERWRF
jgi:hypothetical protein